VILEPPHLQADGRLRASDAAGRAGEAAEVDCKHKRAQHVEVKAWQWWCRRRFGFYQVYVENYQLFFSDGKPMLTP
jgi:hypothetical protein